jgi:hypothetical protein
VTLGGEPLQQNRFELSWCPVDALEVAPPENYEEQDQNKVHRKFGPQAGMKKSRRSETGSGGLYKFPDSLRFAGAAGGAKYRIGVRSPFTGRRRARFGDRHLRALHALLSFACISRLDEQFSVRQSEFLKRYGRENGWQHLLELLDSWYRIESAEHVLDGTVAETTIFTNAGESELVVRFGRRLAVLLKLLIREPPRIRTNAKGTIARKVVVVSAKARLGGIASRRRAAGRRNR